MTPLAPDTVGEGAEPTLKASFTLLWGCWLTMKVRIKQATPITLRRPNDQGASPPCTATMLQTQIRTPELAGNKKQKTLK